MYYDTGTSDLYHCQEALKVVSRRLNDYYMQTMDETIGAVGLLVIHDISHYTKHRCAFSSSVTLMKALTVQQSTLPCI